MKRLEVYKTLLFIVLKKYSGLSSNNANYQDIFDYIEDLNIIAAVQSLLLVPTLKEELKPLLKTIITFLNEGSILLEQEVESKGKIILFSRHSDEKYSRRLNFFSSSLIVVETQMLYKDSPDTYSLECLCLLECVFLNNKKQEKLLKELVVREQPRTFIIQYDKSALRLSATEERKIENLYAFALAASLNKKIAIEIPNELQFSWGSSPILSSFMYDKDIVYNEFYDIYDAFNDWLHAKDILTAFIKMYQIAEYMIYRRQMVEIVNRGNIKQSFLRETKNLSDKYTKGERSTIISNMIILFNNFSLNATEVTNSWPFVDKYFGLSKNGGHYLDTTKPPLEIDAGAARFIYDVRCAIVHNKESEFHILYNNYEVYKDIVPLMKSIHEIMAEKILSIIQSTNSLIHYNSQHFELY